MGFEQIDEACVAGEKAENADFATPVGTAGINPLKIAKRNIYVSFPLNTTSALRTGSITESPSGTFPGIVFQNAGSGYINLSALMPRGEISPGERGTLKVAWLSAGTAGSIRLVADIKPAITGLTTPLNLAITRNVIQAANSVASAISIAKMEFPPAIFNKNQFLALKLSRDPANTLDTLASDITVIAVWMEILGRC